LTPSGEVVVEQDKSILKESPELTRQLNYLQGVHSGVLNIGVDIYAVNDKIGIVVGQLAEKD